jgi:hypothetical protein
MSGAPREIAGRDIANAESFLRDIAEPCQPMVMRGLVSDWPVVSAGARSTAAFKDYVAQFDRGGQTEAFFGEPRIAGKYYYSDDLKGFNFERRRMRFADVIETIVSTAGVADSPTVYLGSVPVDDLLPGFSAQNVLRVLAPNVGARIWLGHASNVSAHYDTMDNIACVVAGTRRFTLFPPDTISHLYVGPVDHTMAGQPVSLAASSPPDDEKYPLFREVRDRALVAELQPGDAIYIPKLWWHKVEATAPFNALVNYWWDPFAAGPDAPFTALVLSLITISERPPEERRAWKAFFDHYVFRTRGHPLAHLPADQHGMLGPLKPHNYGKLRARVMALLRGGN